MDVNSMATVSSPWLLMPVKLSAGGLHMFGILKNDHWSIIARQATVIKVE